MPAQGSSERNALVLACGAVFDGVSNNLSCPAETFALDNYIAEIARSVEWLRGAQMLDLPTGL